MRYYSIALFLVLCECLLGFPLSNTTGYPYASTRTFSTTTTTFPYTKDSTSNVSYSGDSSSVYNMSCSTAGKALPSLTYVVDTTGSMSLTPLQDATWTLVRSLLASDTSEGRQYTLMEFNDPDVGPLRATCYASDFLNYINYLSPNGGGDCPEYALTGLLKALENSPAGSVVVLATDASAKDSNDGYIINQIYYLIDSKQITIFILGPQPCTYGVYDYGLEIYKDIAASSYGHVLQNVYGNTKIVDFLYYFLQIPSNSTTRLLSLSGDYSYYATNYFVSTDFTALIISAACSNCSVTLYKPSGEIAVTNCIISEIWGLLLSVDSPVFGTWSISVYAGNYYSLRVLGFKDNNSSSSNISSTVCSGCGINASCKKNLRSYTCVCNDGFSGDGYYCYDIDECNYYYSGMNPCNNGYCINTYGSYNCVCSNGYKMENKTCVDIDECSSSSLNSCHPLATCANHDGYYYCYCPPGYFGDGYHCEVDECTKGVCGFARECIKSNGSHLCLDPCYNYTTLNDPTRSTNYYDYYSYYYYYYSYGRSDSSLYGWYRFTGSGGNRMPEFCPSPGYCYARSPIWLSGQHPDVSDGIVNSTGCTNEYGSCCYSTTYIKIKACRGGYHVYKFSGTPFYYSGYCTDPATAADNCMCAEDEECKFVGGRYGCYCRKISNGSALQDLRPELHCGNQEIEASFEKCQLQMLNLNPNNIHLRDTSCRGFPAYNTTNTISVVSVLKNGVCGNVLVSNKTHVIYKNTIYLSLNTNSSLGGEDIIGIDYSCIYPLDIVLSLETALKPFASSVNVSIEGTGNLQLVMALYRDSNFNSVYEGSEVLLTSKTVLYIGIILKSGDNTQYSVVMKNCYATPTRNQSSSSRYDIIKDSCPSKQDSTINVIQNGNSVTGQFSVQLFGYVKDSNVVYLHCEIHVCDKSSEKCLPSCSGVRSFSAKTASQDQSISVGPIIYEDGTISGPPSENGAESWMTDHLAATILIVILNMLFLFS
ncbi:uromodulin-like [Hyperolius riggenbachi]|uniref:uromodulin-like n=1 Tax=Hyperolius riggenbachi TaxID=752182 RepID=UPI0035A37F0D